MAIAVVSWNTRELLRACLRSIHPEVQAGRAEAWVVDNASGDGSAELVRNEFPWVRLIASRENLGFGPAVNLVAQRTTTPWIAVANADIELSPGSLARLLAAGESDPRAGLLAPRLVLPDGTTQHSAYRFPTLGFTLAFNLGVPAISRRLAEHLLLEGFWRGDRSRQVDWTLGAFVLARREAWDAVGGFDPGQWMYAEDLDLAWRVHGAGFTTRFQTDAPVLHHGAAATSQLWGDDRDARWQRSTYAWMLRRRGLPITRAYALINTAGAAARFAAYTVPARVRAGDWPARRTAMRRYARLHLDNLLASRRTLESHR